MRDEPEDEEDESAIEKAMADHIGPKADYFMPIWRAYDSAPASRNTPSTA